MGGNASEYLWIRNGRDLEGKPMLFQEPGRPAMRIFKLRYVTVMAASMNAAKQIQTAYRKQPRID